MKAFDADVANDALVANDAVDTLPDTLPAEIKEAVRALRAKLDVTKYDIFSFLIVSTTAIRNFE